MSYSMCPTHPGQMMLVIPGPAGSRGREVCEQCEKEGRAQLLREALYKFRRTESGMIVVSDLQW